MKTIWKYPLKMIDVQEIEMPEGARILCVQVQHGIPCLWAQVESDHKNEKRKIAIAGSGYPAPEPRDDYVGTFQIHDGNLIFHVFAQNRDPQRGAT